MMLRQYESELTGRARARPGWFGKQVLQVEVRTLSFSACPPRPGSNPDDWQERMRREGETTLHWRDATWEDLTALERLTLVPRTGVEPSQRRAGAVPPRQSPPSQQPARRKRKA